MWGSRTTTPVFATGTATCGRGWRANVTTGPFLVPTREVKAWTALF